MLEARDITVRFSERTVLDDVSLTVAASSVNIRVLPKPSACNVLCVTTLVKL